MIFAIYSFYTSTPIYIHNIDPSYEYLANANNLLNGKLPGHLDHPGFTMQIFISLIILFFIFLRYIFKNNDSFDFNLDYVENSEFYGIFVIVVLILLQTISLWLLTKTLLVYTRHILALFLPLFVLLSLNLLNFITSIRPESLNFTLTILYVAFLIKLSLATSKYIKIKYVFIIAIIVAIGIFSKITFAPFLITIFLIGLKRLRVLFLICCASFSLILLYPIKSILSVEWFVKILTNSGRHGESLPPKLFVNIFQDIINLIFIMFPTVGISLLIFLLFIFRHYRTGSSDNYSLIIDLTILIFSHTIITFKNFEYQDTLNLTILGAVLLIILLSKLFPISEKYSLTVKIFFFSTLLILLNHYLKIDTKIFDFASSYSKKDDGFNSTSEKLVSDRNIVISQYGIPTRFSALIFGELYYGDGSLGEYLYNIYPYNVEFNIWDNSFYFANGSQLFCNDLLTFNEGNVILSISPKNQVDSRSLLKHFEIIHSEDILVNSNFKFIRLLKFNCVKIN